MGIVDWVRRRHESPASEDLLGQLIDGFRREDYKRLIVIINEHSAAIRAQFPSWTTVPADIQNDPARVQEYVNILVAIARVFEKNGDRSLIDRLMKPDRSNPIIRWQQDLERARALTEAGGSVEAIPILRAIVEDMRSISGTAVDQLLPRALGSLGIAFVKTGQKMKAIEVTREALELCRKVGDDEGVRAYAANLRAIGTYDIQQDDGPDHIATVVFTDDRGRILAPEDLANAVGTIKWEVVVRRAINPEAERLHHEGRAAGEREEYDAALSLLTEAANLDPTWPYPIYDRAFTHLLKGEMDEALRDYEKTLELSPRGFYVAAQAVDMLRREAAGELPAGLFAVLVTLEHGTAEEKRSILEHIVRASPSCAAAWDQYANFVDDPAAQLSVIERGLAVPCDPDTRGSLLVRKALRLWRDGQTSGALEILGPLAATVGESLSTHAKAYAALATIRGATGDRTSISEGK